MRQSGLCFLNFAAEIIAFAAGGVLSKGQKFFFQKELTECVLDEREDPAPPSGTLDYPENKGIYLLPIRLGQEIYGVSQIENFLGNIVCVSIGNAYWLA